MLIIKNTFQFHHFMRAKASQLVLTLIACPLCLFAQGTRQLGEYLADIGEYIGDARFEVLLPSAADPVTYDITLQSKSVDNDSLAPCDYLIRWSSELPSGVISGFSAYYSGNHYRFRNNKLQEYHIDEDESAFMPMGKGSEKMGVQSTAQFGEFIPQFIGKRLIEMSSDSTYQYSFHPDTLVSGAKRIVVEGVKRNQGYDVQRFKYVFDKDTKLPLSIDFENSPGSISEQLVTVTYSGASAQNPIEISEEGLIAEWPEVFEKYRESTFRVDNLVNDYLPAFSSQMLGSQERFTHHLREPLGATTIIAVIDPEVSSAQATVEAVRGAVEALPMRVSVIWAFPTNREDAVLGLLKNIKEDEKVLLSANGLIRNAGITLFPTLLIVSSEGIVEDVVTGFNNQLEEIVILKSYKK